MIVGQSKGHSMVNQNKPESGLANDLEGWILSFQSPSPEGWFWVSFS